jgi:DNA-binding NarL/FixJ family response regulator
MSHWTDRRNRPAEPPVTILVVDDDGPFAEALGLMLRSVEGLEVAGTARDGEEAVVLAHRLRPDVVLMDLQMPRVDGVGATRLLRQVTPCAAIVAVSGAAPPEDVERAFEAGAAAFVPKGESLLELARTIFGVARRRPLDAAAA